MVLLDHGPSERIQRLAVLDGSHDLGVSVSACRILGEHMKPKPYLFAERTLHVGRYLLEVLVDYGPCNRVQDIDSEVEPLCVDMDEVLPR